jgi:uncharacterized membrane protein
MSPEKIEIHRSKALLQTELAIAYVLRGGVALSGALLAFGLFSRIFHLIAVHARSRELIAFLLSGGSREDLSAATASLASIRSLDPDSVMAAGLIVLIALPVIRVAMTVVHFIFERDWVYLAITLFVLGLLLFGLFFGYAL